MWIPHSDKLINSPKSHDATRFGATQRQSTINLDVKAETLDIDSTYHQQASSSTLTPLGTATIHTHKGLKHPPKQTRVHYRARRSGHAMSTLFNL